MRNDNASEFLMDGRRKGANLRCVCFAGILTIEIAASASISPVIAPHPPRSTTISVAGPFPDGRDVQLPRVDSEIVEPRAIRLSRRGGASTAAIIFKFKGEATPSKPIRLSVAFWGDNGKRIAHKTLRCTDGRPNAMPAHLFGRTIYGSSVNRENFKIPFGDPRDVGCVTITFTEAR